MTKIQSLGTRELKQVLSLLERFSGDEFTYPVLENLPSLYLSLHTISHFLPVRWKFLPGIYVATQGNQVLGLVWLSKDGHRHERWKIDQVIINPDVSGSYDIAKQLLYFIINRFGGQGVETFLAYVEQYYTEGLALLKDCGFRHCTRLHTYQLKSSVEGAYEKVPSISGLREAQSSDGRKLQELHSETLVPEVRISLRRSPKELHPGFRERLFGTARHGLYRRWVVPSRSDDYLLASVAITSSDFKEFSILAMVSPAWESGTEDLLLFALHQIYKNTKEPKITIQAYEFQKSKIEVLDTLQFQRVLTTEVLVKDYWVQNKQGDVEIKDPVLLFAKRGKTSPA